MKDLYTIAGLSKQALWKHKIRQESVQSITIQMVDLMTTIRSRHKRMGCRRMYYAVGQPIPVGRDIFEKIGLNNGFKLRYKRNVVKTTWAQRIEIHPNLIEGKIIDNINQVWQSDIFYINVEGQNYYGFSIVDIYSRKMLSLHFANNARAEELEKAVKKAIKARLGMDLTGCIFHSDRGSQYISDRIKEILRNNKFELSMSKLPQENAYVERIQGTLKYEYLFEFHLTRSNINKMSYKVLDYYNNQRPHTSLNMLTPTAFETLLENLVKNQHPKMQIYQWKHELSTKMDDANKKDKSSKKEKIVTIVND